MKKEIQLAFCISLIGVFLSIQCTVVKRRYTKGFYVSTTKKAHHRTVLTTAKETADKGIKKTNQAAALINTKEVHQQPSIYAYASTNKIRQRIFAAKPLCPPDSCRDIITFMDG